MSDCPARPVRPAARECRCRGRSGTPSRCVNARWLRRGDRPSRARCRGHAPAGGHLGHQRRRRSAPRRRPRRCPARGWPRRRNGRRGRWPAPTAGSACRCSWSAAPACRSTPAGSGRYQLSSPASSPTSSSAPPEARSRCRGPVPGSATSGRADQGQPAGDRVEAGAPHPVRAQVGRQHLRRRSGRAPPCARAGPPDGRPPGRARAGRAGRTAPPARRRRPAGARPHCRWRSWPPADAGRRRTPPGDTGAAPPVDRTASGVSDASAATAKALTVPSSSSLTAYSDRQRAGAGPGRTATAYGRRPPAGSASPVAAVTPQQRDALALAAASRRCNSRRRRTHRSHPCPDPTTRVRRARGPPSDPRDRRCAAPVRRSTSRTPSRSPAAAGPRAGAAGVGAVPYPA